MHLTRILLHVYCPWVLKCQNRARWLCQAQHSHYYHENSMPIYTVYTFLSQYSAMGSRKDGDDCTFWRIFCVLSDQYLQSLLHIYVIIITKDGRQPQKDHLSAKPAKTQTGSFINKTMLLVNSASAYILVNIHILLIEYFCKYSDELSLDLNQRGEAILSEGHFYLQLIERDMMPFLKGIC